MDEPGYSARQSIAGRSNFADCYGVCRFLFSAQMFLWCIHSDRVSTAEKDIKNTVIGIAIILHNYVYCVIQGICKT